MSNHSEAALRGLLESNINVLDDGLELIQLLDSDQFTENCEPVFRSSIGVHFRHVLEHYSCFIVQWSNGLISYDQRCRDLRLEMDSTYAEKTLLSLCEKLKKLDTDNRPDLLQVSDQPLFHPIDSNLERELLFLLAHTVHHYAIIAAMARLLGKTPKEGFGVAIATQLYLANTVSR